MTNASDYLTDCVYFEVHDDSDKNMNRYCLVNKRWIRSDDGANMLPNEIQHFVEELLKVKRPMTLKFYGRKLSVVKLNG